MSVPLKWDVIVRLRVNQEHTDSEKEEKMNVHCSCQYLPWRLAISRWISLAVILFLVAVIYFDICRKEKKAKVIISDDTSLNLTMFAQQLFMHKVDVDTEVADQLHKDVRVLCFITTMPSNTKRAIAVNATWAKRCTRHLFVVASPMPVFSSDELLYLPDAQEGREHLTAKTFSALNYLYHNELNSYDWFVKADDDVYIVMENLRLMMSKFASSIPVYLGFHMKKHTPQGYMSGGASYSLNREALRIMGSRGIPQNGGICRAKEPDEDVEVGSCLHGLGVKPYKSLDKHGRQTFHAWSIPQTMFKGYNSDYSLHAGNVGPGCCSQLSISFHYVEPEHLYLLEMLLYNIDVYGRHAKDKDLARDLFIPEVELLQ